MSFQQKTKDRDSRLEQQDFPPLLDPVLLRAARQLYRTYCAMNSRMTRQPLGVIINRKSHRGQLAFNDRPILLPDECFVRLQQIESDMY
jgi:alkylhydroperoxidase family enzyme